MLLKTKTIENTSNTLSHLANQVGIAAMTLAAVVGMVELPGHMNSRVILPSQYKFVAETGESELNNPLRREKEDTEQHYISYSEAQRTPSRSGKR